MKCPSCGDEFKVRLAVTAIELKEKKQARKDALPKEFEGWHDWPTKPLAKGYIFSDPKSDLCVIESGQEPPYLIKTPSARLICLYKATIGVNPADRAWDASTAGFARFKPAADSLIKDLGLEGARKCLWAVQEHCASKGLDWNLSTVAKYALDWKHGRLGGIK